MTDLQLTFGARRPAFTEPSKPESYTVTWSYDTSTENTTPVEAALLAYSVILSGKDPAASRPDHLQFSVALDDGTSVADFEVPATPRASMSDIDAMVEAEVERRLAEQGPRLTYDTEFDAFFTVLDRVNGWCVRVENPGQEPVELLLRETGRDDQGEPVVTGPTFDETGGEWSGPVVSVVLGEHVNVVLL